MSWLSAYYSSRDAETTTIVLLVLGACISIAILVFFMVYLYRVERNTKNILWYLKMLTGQQQRSIPSEQENTQDQDKTGNVDSDGNTVFATDNTNTDKSIEQPKKEEESRDRGYIVVTVAIIVFLLFMAIVMAVTNRV